MKFASKYDADIVISADTLRNLAATLGPLFRRTWDIPVTVIEIEMDGTEYFIKISFNRYNATFYFQGEVRKCLFIDGALPPTEMTAVEKNHLFNQIAIKSHFTNLNPRRYYAFPGSENLQYRAVNLPCPSDNQETNVFEATDVDVGALETFGVDKDPTSSISLSVKRSSEQRSDLNARSKSPEKAASPKKPSAVDFGHISSVDSDLSSDEALLIDLGDGSVPSPKKKMKKCHAQKAPDAQEPNLLTSILQGQEKMMQPVLKKEPSKTAAPLKTSNCTPENPLDYEPPLRDHNVCYRTWNLKAAERSIRLLIRSSVDTAIVHF